MISMGCFPVRHIVVAELGFTYEMNLGEGGEGTVNRTHVY